MQAVIYKSGLNNVRAGRVCNWGGTWRYTGADLKKGILLHYGPKKEHKELT